MNREELVGKRVRVVVTFIRNNGNNEVSFTDGVVTNAYPVGEEDTKVMYKEDGSNEENLYGWTFKNCELLDCYTNNCANSISTKFEDLEIVTTFIVRLNNN